VLLVLPKTGNGELSPAIDGSENVTDATITFANGSRSNALSTPHAEERERASRSMRPATFESRAMRGSSG
jgi:hypothetical protein